MWLIILTITFFLLTKCYCVCFTDKQQSDIGIHVQLLVVSAPHRSTETYSWTIYKCTILMSIYVNTTYVLKKYVYISSQTYKCDLHINTSPVPYCLACEWIQATKCSTAFTSILLSDMVTRFRKAINMNSCFSSNYVDMLVSLLNRHLA
jgi:hypothetical protein